MKRLRVNDECEDYIFDNIKLTPHEIGIIRATLPLNNDSVSGWGWGHFGDRFHRNFETRVNSTGDHSDIYNVTNYTDALFRFLYYFEHDKFENAERDLFDKLVNNPFNLNDYTPKKQDKIKQFIKSFLDSGKNRTIFNKFNLNHGHKKGNWSKHDTQDDVSLIFAAFATAMNTLFHLEHGNFDVAYNDFREMSKYITCTRKYGEKKKGGTKRKTPRKTRKRTKRKTPRKTRKRTKRKTPRKTRKRTKRKTPRKTRK